MINFYVNSLEFMFAIALFANALLFLPQGWKIYKQKKSDEVSVITFIGFWFIQLLTVFHALLRHDWILLVGNIISLMTCGTVIFLIIRYRFISNNK